MTDQPALSYTIERFDLLPYQRRMFSERLRRASYSTPVLVTRVGTELVSRVLEQQRVTADLRFLGATDQHMAAIDELARGMSESSAVDAYSAWLHYAGRLRDWLSQVGPKDALDALCLSSIAQDLHAKSILVEQRQRLLEFALDVKRAKPRRRPAAFLDETLTAPGIPYHPLPNPRGLAALGWGCLSLGVGGRNP